MNRTLPEPARDVALLIARLVLGTIMFAHGYQTLVDGTEVVYQVTGQYTPEAERGQRHDDPALGLEWPLPVGTISAKDAAWPLLEGITS